MRQVVVQRPSSPAQVASARTVSPWIVDVDFDATGTGIGFMGTPVPVNCTIMNLKVRLDTAPGGTPWPFTFYKNGSATALGVTISGTNTVATNNTNTFTLAPFDVFCFVWTAADMVNNFTYAFEIETPDDFTSIYGGPGPSTPNWGGFGTGHGDGVGSIAGSTGSITSLLGMVDTAPGLGFHARFWIQKNGINQDGTGGTVDTQCFITDLATQNQKSFTLPIAPQDTIYVNADSQSILVHPRQCLSFVASQKGHFQTCGFRRNVISGTEVYAWHSFSSQTESNGVGIVPKSGLGLTGLVIVGADSHTYKLRYNSSDPVNQPIITLPPFAPGGKGIDSNPAHSISAFEGDLFDVATDQNGPDNYYWGFDSFTTPPTVPTGSFTVTEHTIRRLRRAPHVAQLGQRVYINRFLLDLQPGIGNPTDPGADPQVMLRWSRDGGSTWSDIVSMSAGELGQWFKRVYYWRLGMARDWLFEVTVSDPVSWQLMAAVLDVEEGTN